MYIPVWFLQERFGCDLFVSKYDNPSIILERMCTKLCQGPFIIRSTKWVTVIYFYPTSDT